MPSGACESALPGRVKTLFAIGKVFARWGCFGFQSLTVGEGGSCRDALGFCEKVGGLDVRG
jgi:hypothetical protein